MNSTGNHRQLVDGADGQQQEMVLNQPLHLAKKTRLFPIEEIVKCRGRGDAYFRTFKESGKHRKAICSITGIDSATLTRIFAGTKNMPEDKENLFYEACGNFFAWQWKCYDKGLICSKRDVTDVTDAEAAILWRQQQAVNQ